ncbi:hypothetical protein ABVK25_000116 [Lepraria finkii]|uniref:Uncharacterized protein n=1 Tax=Lepraria finkii TaxID=1340010 RepID=A0ABR4BM35_9LECA
MLHMIFVGSLRKIFSEYARRLISAHFASLHRSPWITLAFSWMSRCVASPFGSAFADLPFAFVSSDLPFHAGFRYLKMMTITFHGIYSCGAQLFRPLPSASTENELIAIARGIHERALPL